jgi:hypothetical protein
LPIRSAPYIPRWTFYVGSEEAVEPPVAA